MRRRRGGGRCGDGRRVAAEVGAGGIVVVAGGSDVDGATVDGVGANTHSADPLTMCAYTLHEKQWYERVGT